MARRDRQSVAALDPTEGERIVNLADHQRVGSPLWWVQRLYARMIERNKDLDIFDDYYRGEFPLPWLAPAAADEFKRIMRMSRSNYCGLIVDAMVERMTVEGFRIDTGRDEETPTPAVNPLSQQATGAIGAATQGKRLNSVGANALAAPSPGSIGTTRSSGFSGTTIGEADRETWRIWQANGMDTLFDQALLEAAICGTAYLMIAPNDEDPKTPHIWVEHPTQCIVEYKPGTQRHEVAAGLKVWVDEPAKMVFATLYLPGQIYKFEAKRPPSGTVNARSWKPRSVNNEAWPAETSLDFVPIFELPNNPRMLTGGRSELVDVLDTQDRIVKTIADRLITQDYGAFPQKWISGWPEEDSSGRPTPKIDVGRDRAITTDVAEAKFGQFAAADLQGYMLAKKEDVHDMAARTRTPAQYLLGEFSNVNGETLKASESGLVAKVRERMRGYSDPLENAVRALRKMAGIDTDDDDTMEVVWRNPEFKTEGEQVDALTKMSTLGVPQQALWERWGASPPEIQRWSQMQAEAAAQQAALDAQMLLADSYRTGARGAGGGSSGSRASGGQDRPRTPGQNGSGSSARSSAGSGGR